jgi:GNAT superfamily N-acetyltransferase
LKAVEFSIDGFTFKGELPRNYGLGWGFLSVYVDGVEITERPPRIQITTHRQTREFGNWDFIKFDEFDLKPEYQSKGLGTKIYYILERKLRELYDPAYFKVYVNTTWEKAFPFWKMVGFTVDGPPEDECVNMVKRFIPIPPPPSFGRTRRHS